MHENGILAVADLPEPLRLVYPTATGPILVKFGELYHSSTSHPEDIPGKESLIIRTLRGPMYLFQDDRYSNTVNFVQQAGVRHHLFVSVEIDPANREHRMKSARIHRAGRTRRLIERSTATFGAMGLLMDGG